MDSATLDSHVKKFVKWTRHNPEDNTKDRGDREERVAYYQSWTSSRLGQIDQSGLVEYLGKLWAMLIWGNKQYAVDKVIQDNGLRTIQRELSELVWGATSIDSRWDRFRSTIKGIGPAMMSEILCYVHPKDCMIWNRRAYVGLEYLGVSKLPKYNHQLTGKRYKELSEEIQQIAQALAEAGIPGVDLLEVDYFIWRQLQVQENLSQVFIRPDTTVPELESETEADTPDFIHNEVRDKIAEIGRWLGFDTNTETKVADGSVVDAIWQATIGNMGRVIYVFEVQTKGNIDSLLVNLLKSRNNPAVQGVVAVSDVAQLAKIRKHGADIGALSTQLKYWDYREVLQIHDALSIVNESINRLQLVPESFGNTMPKG